MPFPLDFRWGLGVSIFILPFAVYLSLRSTSHEAASQTYCYQGIQTFSETNNLAKCFSVADGRFTQVSSPDTLPVAESPGYVIPGLWDGHGHLLQYGEFLHSVDLFGSASVDEVCTRVVEYLDEHPGSGSRDEWVRGVGWDQMALGGMPTAVSEDHSECIRLSNSTSRSFLTVMNV